MGLSDSDRKLNEAIELFPEVHPITDDMEMQFEGVSRLVMLDRYSFKDTDKSTLKLGDLVLLTVKPDPNFPARGTGRVSMINPIRNEVAVDIDEEYQAVAETDVITAPI